MLAVQEAPEQLVAVVKRARLAEAFALGSPTCIGARLAGQCFSSTRWDLYGDRPQRRSLPWSMDPNPTIALGFREQYGVQFRRRRAAGSPRQVIRPVAHL